MASVLLLGDRQGAGDLRSILRQDGHRVVRLRHPERWREAERSVNPELVVASVETLGDLLEAQGRAARGFPSPILLVNRDEEAIEDAHLDDRLVDQIASPFMSEEFLARVDALVRARRVILRSRPVFERATSAPSEGQGAQRLLRRLGGRIAAVLGTRVPRFEKPLGPYVEVAARIAEWADRRDVFEPGHAERVASYAAMIGEGMGLPDAEASSLLRAAMLHDIGKAAVPAEVLREEGPLSDDQRRLIRTHPERGARLLRALDDDDEVAHVILCHHEQPDGQGYYGKPRDVVPRAASILGVAEAYDAMTSTRLQQPLSRSVALERLRAERGRKYDADCVDALAEALRPRRSIPLSGR